MMLDRWTVLLCISLREGDARHDGRAMRIVFPHGVMASQLRHNDVSIVSRVSASLGAVVDAHLLPPALHGIALALLAALSDPRRTSLFPVPTPCIGGCLSFQFAMRPPALSSRRMECRPLCMFCTRRVRIPMPAQHPDCVCTASCDAPYPTILLPHNQTQASASSAEEESAAHRQRGIQVAAALRTKEREVERLQRLMEGRTTRCGRFYSVADQTPVTDAYVRPDPCVRRL